MKYINTFVFLSLLLLICSCGQKQTESLPILGKKKIVEGIEVDHQIPDWTFLNQDSLPVTNKDLADVVYVSDFFFRSCPTICPKTMREMKRVYTEFKDNPQVKLVSFTIDPKRDTPSKLKQYASNLQVNVNKWWFLQGDKEETYDLALDYFNTAYEDEDVPGGFNHSGKLILTDKNGHIRSFSEGTDPEETPKLINDIKTLLKEYNTNEK
ncbi:MAG: SCO family protein [Saprospiraceae bacterium]|nr:SCO family protein [Saprospiraceae bacterium]